MTDVKDSLLDASITREDPNQVAEMYADRLMDELFGGIERTLAGESDGESEAAPESAATPETAATVPFEATPSGELSPVWMPTATALDAAASSELSAPPEDTASPSTRWRQWSLNRVLLGAAGVSLLATLALWWFNQRQSDPVVATAPAPTVAEQPVNPEAEFLEYLRRSLDVIAQQSQGSAATANATSQMPEISVANLGNGAGLPPLSTPSLSSVNGPGGASPSINVIERVYIPYQTAPAQTAANPVPTTGAATTPTAPTTAAAPATPHVLIGLLELGDRSAALFEINGTPQRVYIGERIGSSGWSLVSVANDEAVIRRNGEVRSIYIGQQF